MIDIVKNETRSNAIKLVVWNFVRFCGHDGKRTVVYLAKVKRNVICLIQLNYSVDNSLAVNCK